MSLFLQPPSKISLQKYPFKIQYSGQFFKKSKYKKTAFQGLLGFDFATLSFRQYSDNPHHALFQDLLASFFRALVLT